MGEQKANQGRFIQWRTIQQLKKKELLMLTVTEMSLQGTVLSERKLHTISFYFFFNSHPPRLWFYFYTLFRVKILLMENKTAVAKCYGWEKDVTFER